MKKHNSHRGDLLTDMSKEQLIEAIHEQREAYENRLEGQKVIIKLLEHRVNVHKKNKRGN